MVIGAIYHLLVRICRWSSLKSLSSSQMVRLCCFSTHRFPEGIIASDEVSTEKRININIIHLLQLFTYPYFVYLWIFLIAWLRSGMHVACFPFFDCSQNLPTCPLSRLLQSPCLCRGRNISSTPYRPCHTWAPQRPRLGNEHYDHRYAEQSPTCGTLSIEAPQISFRSSQTSCANVGCSFTLFHRW